MKYLIALVCFFSPVTFAADINQNSIINCISFDSTLKGTHQNGTPLKESGKVR